MTTRAGFAAVIGAPNAGKSTLVNRLVGSKVSIVTQKVQTTRFPVRGVAMEGEAQIVLVDTPGIFRPRRRLDRAMVRAAWGGARGRRRGRPPGRRRGRARRAGPAPRPPTSAPPRTSRTIDRGPEGAPAARRSWRSTRSTGCERDDLLALTQRLFETGVYAEVFMISAPDGSGVDDLKARLAELMPEGPWLYPEDQTADLPARLLAAEITREKLYLRVHEELPYAATVETTAFEERKDGSARIEQTIYVERESQRADRARQGRPDPEVDRRSRAQGAGRDPRPPGAPVPARQGRGELGRGARLLPRPGLDFDV